MIYVTNGYEPKRALEIFEDISRIPRGSGNEAEIAAYIENFAKSRGLYAARDAYNNVYVRKAASEGYEAADPVAMQGHIDMVCEKDPQKEHDFTRDPLSLRVEDGMLYADRATLGADDGVAVAMMMAILEDDNAAHPELECVFTSDEEKGMSGAKGFDCSLLRSKRLINLDNEEEGLAVISSAGCMRSRVVYECEGVGAKNKFVEIKVKGLSGGHSGNEIDKHRTSALSLMAMLLCRMYEREPFELVSIDGGGLDNAIARDCTAVLSVLDIEPIKEMVQGFMTEIMPTVSKADKGLRIHVSKHRREETMLTYADTRKLISLLMLMPQGVSAMSHSIPGLVETSNNIGSVTTMRDGAKYCVTAVNLTRSCVDSALDMFETRFRMLVKAFGAEFYADSRYSGWVSEKGTYMQTLYTETFKRLFDREPTLAAIHAGLECGVFAAGAPGIDILSIGPDNLDIHSPNEHLDLASFERTYRLVCEMLKAMK